MDGMIHRPRIVLFDIAGVLVELSGGPHCLLQGDAWAKWQQSLAVRLFETGRCSALEFGLGFVSEFALDREPLEILEILRSWPRGIEDGAPEFIHQLYSLGYDVATLSNTNSIHWSQIASDLKLESLIATNFLSHELGILKPDPSLFAYVVDYFECKPCEILFFDDSIANVRGARAAGLNAHRVQGIKPAVRYMSTRGWLEPDVAGEERVCG